MVLVQKWQLFQLSFLGNIGQENVCYHILERKNVFLGYKNTKFKKFKNQHFSKGFWSKNGHFSNFFSSAIQARKMSFAMFQTEKTPFQAVKKKVKKGRKIDISPKGLTHGFGPKMAICSTFFFRQYRPGKCLLQYSRTKKTPFKLIKTRSSKSQKN